MSKPIHHPHDAFFRKALAHVEVARDLLQAHLAPELVQRIDWPTLQVTNKSYVKKTLQQLHSDMVYQCQIDGQAGYLYCLIEQQTKPERLLPFRILQYNVALLEEHLQQGAQQLPLIVNLCLYTGQQSPYPYSMDIYDCFENPTLARSKMFKPLQLIDLSTYTQEALSHHGQADLLELLLKQGARREFLHWLGENPNLLLQLLDRIYGVSGIVYILEVERKSAPQELLDLIHSLAPDKQRDIMTAAQQLREEGMQRGLQRGKKVGMQQGMQRGMQQEKVLIAKNLLLHLDLGLDAVQKATGLSRATLESLRKSL